MDTFVVLYVSFIDRRGVHRYLFVSIVRQRQMCVGDMRVRVRVRVRVWVCVHACSRGVLCVGCRLDTSVSPRDP